MPEVSSRTVFLSYSWKDGRELALSLKRELEREHVTVWMDADRIHGGASWTRQIEDAIAACDVVIGIITTGSYRSEVCRAEHIRALRLGKCLIPVRGQLDAEFPCISKPETGVYILARFANL